MAAAILGAVLVALAIGLLWFSRYSRTEAFRHGDLRQATLGLLMAIGPFFGVHVKPPEPEPATVSAPKGDSEDPLAERLRISTPGATSDGDGPPEP
jgi:hypothetical protein